MESFTKGPIGSSARDGNCREVLYLNDVVKIAMLLHTLGL